MAERTTDTLVTEPADNRSVEAGLDALETAPELPPKPGIGQVLVRSVLPPVVFLALLVGVWQIAYVAKLKPSYALPGPAEVWSTFLETVSTAAPWRPSG